METTFYQIGKEICDNEKYIQQQMDSVEWIELKKGDKLPLGQGMAIQGTIKEFKIPKVSHVAIHGNLDNLGFYGIRGHYKNGVFNIFIADNGCEIIPIAGQQIK